MMESHAQENMPLSVGFALKIAQEEPHFISLNIVKSKIDVVAHVYIHIFCTIGLIDTMASDIVNGEYVACV